MANIKVNEQQEQRSQQGSQQSLSRGPQTGVTHRGTPWPAQELFPSTPFSITNPFSMMRRMIAALEPDWGESRFLQRQEAFIPPVEVSKSNGDIVVCADLPGMKPDEIKLEIAGGALVVQGERRSEHEETNGGTRRTEVRYGQFYRSIPLPEGADIEHVKAKFDNGVLEVKIPLPQQQSRQIPIEGGSQQSSASQPTGSQQRS